MPVLLITGASGGVASALRALAIDAGWTVVAVATLCCAAGAAAP
jgi:NADP-dependent 3-hydroxy acid dehydrogenase YdfG